jgi:hypothetical protein
VFEGGALKACRLSLFLSIALLLFLLLLRIPRPHERQVTAGFCSLPQFAATCGKLPQIFANRFSDNYSLVKVHICVHQNRQALFSGSSCSNHYVQYTVTS